jgi:hypothetical protein
MSDRLQRLLWAIGDRYGRWKWRRAGGKPGA